MSDRTLRHSSRTLAGIVGATLCLVISLSALTPGMAVGTRILVAVVFLGGALFFLRGARGGTVLRDDDLLIRAPWRTRWVARPEIKSFDTTAEGAVVASLVSGERVELWGVTPGFGAGRDEARVTASLADLRDWLSKPRDG